jgi:hypothetical protein
MDCFVVVVVVVVVAAADFSIVMTAKHDGYINLIGYAAVLRVHQVGCGMVY